MSWLGWKPDPKLSGTIPPETDVSLHVAPHPSPAAPAARTEMPKVASIGKSLHVKGELSGNEDLAIDGEVEGTISLNGYNVSVGETGRVTAKIQAKSVVIGGLVTGNVTSDEKVEVAATGTLVGDIRAPRVALADGSRFKGSIDMDQGPATSKATVQPSSSDRAPVQAGATKS